jgi:hypothetical protein
MLRARVSRIHRSGRAVWIASAALLGAPCLVMAQQAAAPPAPSPGHGIPTPDQLEPGVSTTSATPAAAATPATSSDPASTAAQVAPPSTATATARDPSGAAPAAASRAGTSPKASGTAPGRQQATTAQTAHKGADRLELDATDITGNRELPKVLYIVPWKRSDLGDVVGRPVNSLLDEVLQPLDRDVFQRENRYYDGLKTGAGDKEAGAAQGSPNKP